MSTVQAQNPDEHSPRNGTFQDLGNGVYRVGGLQRCALTGRYVTDKHHEH